ncbi:hypothetical protein H8356DRAFT_1324910 [Neocallimastix lanati (nom. inval.)]|nr:hypothetical protein H8356DRAFT_1324910 [Neocallimastix sp. JGI-2020a]
MNYNSLSSSFTNNKIKKEEITKICCAFYYKLSHTSKIYLAAKLCWHFIKYFKYISLCTINNNKIIKNCVLENCEFEVFIDNEISNLSLKRIKLSLDSLPYCFNINMDLYGRTLYYFYHRPSALRTRSASISTKDESRPSSSINDESGKSLVDTTLSILKMLLLVQSAEIHRSSRGVYLEILCVQVQKKNYTINIKNCTTELGGMNNYDYISKRGQSTNEKAPNLKNSMNAKES